MKGIELIKRMPLELQKEFAREFVKQKSKRELVDFLNRDFQQGFMELINTCFSWCDSQKGFYYWQTIAYSEIKQPTKTK